MSKQQSAPDSNASFSRSEERRFNLSNDLGFSKCQNVGTCRNFGTLPSFRNAQEIPTELEHHQLAPTTY